MDFTFDIMELSEQTKLEAQIGFLVGILVGAIAGGVLILFFTPWQWYFKLFSAIGSLGIIGSLLLSLNETLKARRNYLETIEEMKKINMEANNTIEDADKSAVDIKKEIIKEMKKKRNDIQK